MKSIFKKSLYILVAVLVGVTSVYATSKLTPPDSVTNTMYSLTDIYNLASGTTTTEGTGAIDATPETIAETGKTLTEVYDAVASALAELSGGLPATGQTSCWNNAGNSVVCINTGQDGDILSGLARAYTDNENNTISDTATGFMWIKDSMQVIPWTTNKGTWTTNTEYTVGDLVNDPDACAGVFGCSFWIAQTAHLSAGRSFAEDRATNPLYWIFTPWVRNDSEGVWQGGIWQESLTNCESLVYGGYSDWRLPNINELHSLVNYENFNPAIDSIFFPNTQLYKYWSSTSSQVAGSHDVAWGVDFSDGSINGASKITELAVRCVR